MTNRIPFSYEKLSAGFRAVTRDGVYPTEVHRFETVETFPLMVVINGNYRSYLDNGTTGGPRELPYDLFLEPPVRVEWWNVYPEQNELNKANSIDQAQMYRLTYKPRVLLKATYHGDDKDPISVELVKKEV